MRAGQRALISAVVAAGLVLTQGGAAYAHECFNISKHQNNPGAGAQVVFDVVTEEPVSMTNGLENRVERGLVDVETGEGFHGIIGGDHDGDGTADSSTFIVTPTGAIPHQAQESGSPDHGIVNVCAAGFCE